MRWPPKDPGRVQTGFALFGAQMDDGTFILWERFHFRMLSSGQQIKWAWGTKEPDAPTRPPPPKPSS